MGKNPENKKPHENQSYWEQLTPDGKENVVLTLLIETEIALVDPDFFNKYCKEKQILLDSADKMRLDIELADKVQELRTSGKMMGLNGLSRWKNIAVAQKNYFDVLKAINNFQSVVKMRLIEDKMENATAKRIAAAVRKAQKLMKKKGGPKPGDIVAHPSDILAYRLDRIVNGIAFVSIPADERKKRDKVEKQFPANELFDPNVAKDIALASKFGGIPLI